MTQMISLRFNLFLTTRPHTLPHTTNNNSLRKFLASKANLSSCLCLNEAIGLFVGVTTLIFGGATTAHPLWNEEVGRVGGVYGESSEAG